MGAKRLDLVGKRFGRLMVLKKIGSLKFKKDSSRSRVYWLCICDCGNKKRGSGRNLVDGDLKSCGCLKKERAALMGKANKKHEMTKTDVYKAWVSMKYRCHNKNCPEYNYYGKIGIKVYKEWQKDFVSFYNYIGPKPSIYHSIDRINNKGDYEPGNVRWASKREQVRNRGVSIPKIAYDIIDVLIKSENIKWRIAYGRFRKAAIAFNKNIENKRKQNERSKKTRVKTSRSST